jgi:hypothetical protein
MYTCRSSRRYVHAHPGGGGAASGELNQIGVQQDLDQSPEEPKACVGTESEEGKHRFHLTHFIN